MAFEGMDVEHVTVIYQQMSGLSQQLQSIVSTMPNLVSQLEGAWQGPDARMFASQWPTYQGQLQGALHALEEMCQHTYANLQQQETASNTY
jgi:uncharacterized protein YukE